MPVPANVKHDVEDEEENEEKKKRPKEKEKNDLILIYSPSNLFLSVCFYSSKSPLNVLLHYNYYSIMTIIGYDKNKRA